MENAEPEEEVKGDADTGPALQTLVQRSPIKAAVWTQIALNIQSKNMKTDKDRNDLAYYELKLERRQAKLTAENIPQEKFLREVQLVRRKSPQFF